MSRGLITPARNTLAQVLWAKEAKHLGDGIAQLDSLVRRRADAFEAEFKLRLREGAMPQALAACRRWMEDEPFAARPKQEITYIAALLDDHELARKMAAKVLRIDGKLSVRLELNAIFAKLSGEKYGEGNLAELRRVEARLEELAEMNAQVAVHATANLALLNYRHQHELGKALYRAAIDLARKTDGLDSAAHAAIFAAREALIAGDPAADVELASAIELATRAGNEACLLRSQTGGGGSSAGAGRSDPVAEFVWRVPQAQANPGGSQGRRAYVLTVG
ncbi:MAG: hypothetical protein U5L03_07205 [Burkholderiaceae bacterium]|nr:hypothetical protein [Burkholderiaceae bacterium]